MPLRIRGHVVYPPSKPKADPIRFVAHRDVRPWTDREDEIVLKHYGRMPTNELAGMIRRTVKAVGARASVLRNGRVE